MLSLAINPEIPQLRLRDHQLVREAMQQLPPEFREALILRELEGLSYRQIAEVVGLPSATVRLLLARAQKRLIEGLLNPCAAGELNPMRSLDIERHIESCPDCACAYRELRQLGDAIRAISPYHRRRVIRTSARGPHLIFWLAILASLAAIFLIAWIFAVR